MPNGDLGEYESYFKAFELEIYRLIIVYYKSFTPQDHGNTEFDFLPLYSRLNSLPEETQAALEIYHQDLEAIYQQYKIMIQQRKDIVDKIIDFDLIHFDYDSCISILNNYQEYGYNKIVTTYSQWQKYMLMDTSRMIFEFLSYDINLNTLNSLYELKYGSNWNNSFGIDSYISCYFYSENDRPYLYHYEDYVLRSQEFELYLDGAVNEVETLYLTFKSTDEFDVDLFKSMLDPLKFFLEHYYQLEDKVYEIYDVIQFRYGVHELQNQWINEPINNKNMEHYFSSCQDLKSYYDDGDIIINLEEYKALQSIDVEIQTYIYSQCLLLATKIDSITNTNITKDFPEIEALYNSMKYFAEGLENGDKNIHYDVKYHALILSFQIRNLLETYPIWNKNNYVEVSSLRDGYYDEETKTYHYGIEDYLHGYDFSEYKTEFETYLMTYLVVEENNYLDLYEQYQIIEE